MAQLTHSRVMTLRIAICRHLVWIACLVAASLTSACQPEHDKAAHHGGKGSAILPVRIEALKMHPIEESSVSIGELVSPNSVTLHPQISGYITKIFRKSGDHVTTGMPIIEVNPQKQISTINAYEAAVSIIQANKENAQHTLQSLEFSRASQVANLNFDKEQFQRYKDLYEQDVVSEEEMQKYANTLATTEAGLKKIDSDIRAQQASIASNEKSMQEAKANVKAQGVELSYYTIKAPFEGELGDVTSKLGDFVDTSTELTTVSRNRPLEVYLHIPAVRADQLKQGLPVDLLNADGNLAGQARVFFISPRVETDTQTILIKALFANDKSQFRTGQTLKARIDWNNKERLSVPVTAVVRIAEQDFVYVAEGSDKLTAKLKPVKLGDIIGQSYEVESGIQAGERVIVSGTQSLSDGAQISQQPASE